MHVNDLLRLDGPSFVEEAYSTILKRQVDPSGMDHYMRRLALGDGKEAIIFALATSSETNGSRIDVVGLNELLKRHRKSPWRRFIQSFFGIASTQRQLARIEHLSAIRHHELLLEVAKTREMYQELKTVQGGDERSKPSGDALKDTLLSLQESLANAAHDTDMIIEKFKHTIRSSALVFSLD